MVSKQLLRVLGRQKWIRFGIRDRIIRMFDNIDTREKELFTVPFFGKEYPGNLAVYIDWSTYYYGAYTGEELDFMRDALNGVAEPVLMDVGANVGHHTLFASTIAKEVHAFEPFPEVASQIHEKIRVNLLTNVHIHEVGLGEANETLPYSVPLSDKNTGTGSFVAGKKGRLNTLDLPIVIGDEYLESLHLSKLDFIKMDIEGYEPQAIRGLRKTLYKYRPIVFFEWTSNELGAFVEVKTLFPDGYTIYDFNANQPLFGLFNRQGYTLTKNMTSLHDGNKIALPDEDIGKFADKIVGN